MYLQSKARSILYGRVKRTHPRISGTDGKAVILLALANLCNLQLGPCRALMMVCHQSLMRGDTARNLCIGDMIHREYKCVQPQSMHAIYFRVTRGKTNSGDREDYYAIARHKDPLQCALGPLATTIIMRAQKKGGLNLEDFISMKWYVLLHGVADIFCCIHSPTIQVKDMPVKVGMSPHHICTHIHLYIYIYIHTHICIAPVFV